MYAGITVEHLTDMFSSLTGLDLGVGALLEVAERVYNLQRLFNIREGVSADDDTVPPRVLEQPMFGKYKNEQGCSIRDYQAMLQEYYEARGWDLQTGAPTQYTLKRLGLRKFHDRL